MATPRSVFLSHSSSISRLYLSPPTPHIHRRPHVTTHRSRSEVSSSSSTFTTLLPPCTPSTRRALLFYYSTRPRRVRLVASAYIPGDLSSPSFFPLLLSLISSTTAACFSTNGETGISASNTRIFCCCCCCCSLCSLCSLLPLLFCLRHLLLEARLQLVCLGFGTSRRREDPSRVILLFVLSAWRYRHVSVNEVARIKIMYVISKKSQNLTRIYTTDFFRLFPIKYQKENRADGSSKIIVIESLVKE